METTRHHTTDKLSYSRSLLIGVSQIFALFAGISRSGITMFSGILSGLDYEDSARFSFLLATPIILGAGVYKLGDFLGPLSNGARPQILLGGLVAGIAAYFSVRFLDKYFRNKTLRPFGIYCLVVALICVFVGVSGLRKF